MQGSIKYLRRRPAGLCPGRIGGDSLRTNRGFNRAGCLSFLGSPTRLYYSLELPQEDVAEALDAVCSPVSLYDPVFSDGGEALTVMDQVKDTKNTEMNWMEHITLRNAFRNLGEREKQILQLRFYDGKTQMEVAGRLGISQAQVSRLEKGAINTIKKNIQ